MEQPSDVEVTKPQDSGDPYAELRAEIYDFAISWDFPKPRSVNIYLHISEEDITIFSFSYGELRDCEMGCICSKAFGIKNNSKIDWIQFEDMDGYDTSGVEMYDYDVCDEYMYTEEFFIELNAAYDWVYHYAFLPSVVKDSDTPEETLLRIAEYLYDFINPTVASSLLANPEVQQNVQILTIIANVPVFRGDAYQQVRVTARNLLELLD